RERRRVPGPRPARAVDGDGAELLTAFVRGVRAAGRQPGQPEVLQDLRDGHGGVVLRHRILMDARQFLSDQVVVEEEVEQLVVAEHPAHGQRAVVVPGELLDRTRPTNQDIAEQTTPSHDILLGAPCKYLLTQGREPMRLLTTLAALLLAVPLFTPPLFTAPASADTPPPPSTSDSPSDAPVPGLLPAGVNDWSCRSRSRPVPLILVHGTFANALDNWFATVPALRKAGHCVYAFNYGGKPHGFFQGTGDITVSARQLAAFVQEVKSKTGAEKVDLVGHSQGGMMPRYYLK